MLLQDCISLLPESDIRDCLDSPALQLLELSLNSLLLDNLRQAVLFDLFQLFSLSDLHLNRFLYTLILRLQLREKLAVLLNLKSDNLKLPLQILLFLQDPVFLVDRCLRLHDNRLRLPFKVVDFSIKKLDQVLVLFDPHLRNLNLLQLCIKCFILGLLVE